MSTVAWEPPPSPTTRTYRSWRLIAEQLRERPGQWARVSEHPTHQDADKAAYRVRAGKAAGTSPKGSFEAVARPHGDKHAVYARYVGEESGDE